jgi:molybdenum cofactor cytidylyltransferase
MGSEVDAVVLAAGRARRMGRPKHLIPIEGTPMLLRVVRALRASRVRGITVVLRADDADGERLLAREGVRAVRAESPDEGRAASIRAGVRATPPGAALLFAMADQPFLEPGDFDALIGAHRAGDILCARYAGERGTPVLFASGYRAELLGLRGAAGGREVLARHPERVRLLDLEPDHGRDVDSPEDLAAIAERQASDRR